MTIVAATVLDEAASLLLDVAHRTWPADDLLGYLNEALRKTALVKPTEFYVVETSLALAAGVQQNLPGDAMVMIDVPRNTGDYSAGVGGRVITQVDKGLLDESNRFWPAGTVEQIVEHFTVDPRNPRRFVVFPPNDGSGAVDVIYGAAPPQVMYAAEEIDVPATYQAPLLDFVMARCYQKNSKRQDLTKAAAFMQSWGQALGLETQAMLASTPKVASEPGTTT